MVSWFAVLAMLNLPPAFATSNLGATLTNTTVVDSDGAGQLSPFPLAVAPGTVSPGGYIRHAAAFRITGADAASNFLITQASAHASGVNTDAGRMRVASM